MGSKDRLADVPARTRSAKAPADVRTVELMARPERLGVVPAVTRSSDIPVV